MAAKVKKAGLMELLVWLAALASGTLCSVLNKQMLLIKAENMAGETSTFACPLFQTFAMFLGMLMGLIGHFIVKAFKIPFPGYDHDQPEKSDMPTWMYFYLIIPACFDLSATFLSMCGLNYVNVSIYQMLRGAAIVFVAILKEFFLGDKLTKYMWVGIFWNVVAIVLVGAVALLEPQTSDDDAIDSNLAWLGLILILCSAGVGSLQYAFEERAMKMDVAAPPLFLIGMEGLWGCVIVIFIMYPIAYFTPGNDFGSFENPFNTYYMLAHSNLLFTVFLGFFLTVFGYNLFGILVTFMLHSVWRAILDNFRPMTVWGCSLYIYYNISSNFGESWSQYSWIQVVGLVVLLYGTAIYNAPNSGSLELRGQWWAFFLDFSDEYGDEWEDNFAEEPIDFKSLPSPILHSPYLRSTPKLRPSPTRTNEGKLLQMTAGQGGKYGVLKDDEQGGFKDLKKTMSLGL